MQPGAQFGMHGGPMQPNSLRVGPAYPVRHEPIDLGQVGKPAESPFVELRQPRDDDLVAAVRGDDMAEIYRSELLVVPNVDTPGGSLPVAGPDPSFCGVA